MGAQILSICMEAEVEDKRGDWRQVYFDHLNEVLDEIGRSAPMDKLWDITDVLMKNRSQILGQMAAGLIRSRYSDLSDQQEHLCPGCGKSLKTRGKHRREVETLIGKIALERPYFYCVECKKGIYPLDEVLCLSGSVKQYDLQDLQAWLASELPFDTAAQALERCTGHSASVQNVHACTNRIAQDLTILDVCPTREEIEAKVTRVRAGRFRRPVLMLALDGGHTPTRPEPSPREGKRGKGEWKEAKGFRFYLVDEDRIEPLISWHRIGTDQDLVQDLQTIRQAGLIPETKVRLCIIGDGAAWIWNRVREIFPGAKEVLDFYHCSEHLHQTAHAQYGTGTRQAREWVEATLTRLFHNQVRHVLAGLKRMNPTSAEAEKQIRGLIGYLTRHRERVHYGAARRGGYHIGSGAIESANKFIAHVRLKRSGAWWYVSYANNVLKLRCAKFNGTYDRILELYRSKDQQAIRLKQLPPKQEQNDS